jgi:selenocysteine-specific translation elongation factor
VAVTASITIAVVGASDIAKELAKMSTQSDVTLYHLLLEARALSIVEPSQYPEKFASLLYALALSDRAILVAKSLDRNLAETAATLDLFELPVEVRYGSEVGREELGRAFRGLRLAEAPIGPLDLVKLREELSGLSRAPSPGPPIVVIDHYFPVKGVGTVALGFVRQGVLEPHVELRLYPSARVVEVRSVQVHDVDVQEAESGERVGLALKGVAVDELARGQLLAPEGTLQVATELHGRGGRKCPYYRGDLVVGAHLQALIGAQLVPADITALDGSSGTFETDRPVAWRPGDLVVLADLSAPQGPRCVGRYTL